MPKIALGDTEIDDHPPSSRSAEHKNTTSTAKSNDENEYLNQNEMKLMSKQANKTNGKNHTN